MVALVSNESEKKPYSVRILAIEAMSCRQAKRNLEEI
jgi:hypothetical protein